MAQIQSSVGQVGGNIADLDGAPGVRDSKSAARGMDIGRWLAHFQRNHENRPEPLWESAITLTKGDIRPLVRSLAQFELGDGGGPDRLIGWDSERFLADPEVRELVGLWFAEEAEHSRLLGKLVKRFKGKKIKSHWSFTAFCCSRIWFGTQFELTILLLTEIVSTAYYRLMHRHGDDPAVHGVCHLILRDEAGHVAFHRDHLARSGKSFGCLWEMRFRALGYGAATMLYVNHAAALNALGGSRKEFYAEVDRELTRFVALLRLDCLSLITKRSSDPQIGHMRCVKDCSR
jgi:hypothetical protein